MSWLSDYDREQVAVLAKLLAEFDNSPCDAELKAFARMERMGENNDKEREEYGA